MNTTPTAKDSTTTVVTLKTRDEASGRNAWRTDRAFLNEDDARSHVANNPDAYPAGTEGNSWQLGTAETGGTLATLVAEAKPEPKPEPEPVTETAPETAPEPVTETAAELIDAATDNVVADEAKPEA